MTIPHALPDGFHAYARSPDFTQASLPARLQAAHTTKAGTWGLLHVLEGSIIYRLEPRGSGERLVVAGQNIVIQDQVPHHVAFVTPGRIYIEFYRKTDAGGSS